MANQLTYTELCGCSSDEKAMCENYAKDDTETDNDSSDEKEAADGYGVLWSSVILSTFQVYEKMCC